jgi:cytochrome oxidase Cu insertion factor (SCO1/SenC/PrrC family)
MGFSGMVSGTIMIGPVCGCEPAPCLLTFPNTTKRRVLVLNVGATVPDFELLDQQGQSVTLGELLRSGPLVVYFFVKAKTPG